LINPKANKNGKNSSKLKKEKDDFSSGKTEKRGKNSKTDKTWVKFGKPKENKRADAYVSGDLVGFFS
jgi:hypothetical protein